MFKKIVCVHAMHELTHVWWPEEDLGVLYPYLPYSLKTGSLTKPGTGKRASARAF